MSVVILTWNSMRHVGRCLGSLMGSDLCELDSEIIVIDNGSVDGTRSISRSFRHPVPMVEAARHKPSPALGLSSTPKPRRSSCEKPGLKLARGEYIMILDVDTVVPKRCFSILTSIMSANLRIGVLAPRLQSEDGSLQHSCRRFPTLVSKLARRLPGSWAERAVRADYMVATDGLVYVDYAIGAAQFIRRKALNEVGWLDERIFYGPEDVDFCLRMWQSGWAVAHVPDPVIVHHESRITKRRLLSKVAVRHIIGLVYYFVKHRYLFGQPRAGQTHRMLCRSQEGQKRLA